MRRDSLEYQLDCMRSYGEFFLGEYEVMSRQERHRGGQGVVQCMRGVGKRSGIDVAVKFFLSSEDFDTEFNMYKVEELRSMMPRIDREEKNEDLGLKNSRGYPWPSFIVLEKGQSLLEWKKQLRNEPDVSTIVNVRHHPQPCSTNSNRYDSVVFKRLIKHLTGQGQQGVAFIDTYSCYYGTVHDICHTKL